jgi:RHS repeat-associated protein
MMESFTTYTEAVFTGNVWIVRTDDGTEYEFGLPMLGYRNPTQNTAQLAAVESQSIAPRMEVVKWLLTEIRNHNHANSQRISLRYDLFGAQNQYHELRQRHVYDYLRLQSSEVTVVDTSNLGYYGDYGYSLGDTVVFTGYAEFDLPTPHTEALLREVIALDADNTVISRAELKYHSWRPETHLAIDPLRMARGRWLLLSDPEVTRNDSLYSRKTVWWQGSDRPASQVHEPLGSRGPIGGITSFTGWRRYQHPAAHQNPLTPLRPNLLPENPYVANYPTIEGLGVPGLRNGSFYLMSQDVPPNGEIALTHSVLESPRLEDVLPSGDLYELRTTLEVPSGADMNLDVNIVSGLDEGYAGYDNDLKEKTFAYGGSTVHATEAPMGSFPIGGYWNKSLTIYSTFPNIVKWNPAYQNRSSTVMTTRNIFRLPNLPSEFKGWQVQIGPAADNLRHGALSTSEHGYPEYYNNLHLGPVPPTDSVRLHVTPWFGTGAPLEPLHRTNRFGIVKGASTDKGWSDMRFNWWHLPVGVTYSKFDLLDFGANQPTAVTMEQLKAGSLIPSTPIYHWQDMAAAHTTTDSRLVNMELVRIAKNPWLLDTVIFTLQQGGPDDLVALAAYHLEYHLEQVPILNNVDEAQWALLNPGWPMPMDYKAAGGDTLFRNVFQLTGIERLAVDANGVITGSGGVALGGEELPSTFFTYYPPNAATKYLPEELLLKDIWNERGARQTVVYDLSSLDTSQVNQTEGWSGEHDFNSRLLGGGRLKWLRVRVAEIQVENPNATSGKNITSYSYHDPVSLHRGFPLNRDMFHGMNQNPELLWMRGFTRTVVRSPDPVSGLPTGPYTEVEHRVATATVEDQLLFGTVKRSRSYDASGRLLGESSTTLKVDKVYLNGNRFDAAGLFDHGQHMVTRLNPIWSYENQYLLGTPDDWMMDSYFLRVTDQDATARDPNTGHAVETHTHLTYYDWNLDRIDTEGDYAEMWPDPIGMEELASVPYYDPLKPGTRQERWTYWFEPSWQVASEKVTWSDRPGAYKMNKYFYLWDAWPYLTEGDELGAKWIGTARPYHLARKYGIRNVPYETEGITHNGDPRERPFKASTYLWYDVFKDVNPDLVMEFDSTHYGKRCGGIGPSGSGTGGGHVIVGYCTPTALAQDVNDPSKVALSGIVADEVEVELVDDPRWVRADVSSEILDSSGGIGWYYLEVSHAVGLTVDDFIGIKNWGSGIGTLPLKVAPESECPVGFAVGLPDSLGRQQTLYWGVAALDTVGIESLDLTGIEPATLNHGSEWMHGDSLTGKSQEKLSAPLVSLHPAGCGSGCTVAHAVSDSLASQLVVGGDDVLDGTPAKLANGNVGWQWAMAAYADREVDAVPVTPIGSGIGGGSNREKFTDALADQFYLRSVWVQADTTPSRALSDSINLADYLTPHNIWDLQPKADGKPFYGQTSWHVFRPAFPVIRTYHVERRNDLGLVVEESDVRHLHYLYEYDHGKFRAWWDSCGVPHITYSRHNYAAPRSVTITDYEGIHHTGVMEYNKSLRLARQILPNGEVNEYRYDAWGRLSESWRNGLLRHSYHYHQWQGDFGDSWSERTSQNYLHTVSWDGTHARPLHTYAFSDPNGQQGQGVASVDVSTPGSAPVWLKRFTGATDVDGWGRALKEHQSYSKSGQPDPGYDPVVPSLPFASARYEPLGYGNLTALAKPGNSLGAKDQRFLSEITTLERFFTESRITAAEFQELFPQFTWVPGVPGKIYLPSPSALSGYHCSRTVTTDEDGKQVVSYSDASGRALGSIGYTVNGSTVAGTEVITLQITDVRGIVRKVIHPNKLVSEHRVNFLGWVTQTKSPDAGVTRYLYTQAGDLWAVQDEALRAGTMGQPGKYRALVYLQDRMGRVLHEEVDDLGEILTFDGPVPPFMHKDTLGVTYRNLYSIVDVPGRLPGESNANDGSRTWDLEKTLFPNLWFSRTLVERVRSVRYDKPRTATTDSWWGPAAIVPDGWVHPNLTGRVDGPHYLVGRTSVEITYQANLPVEIRYFSYNIDGGLEWVATQFEGRGISGGRLGEAHLLLYPAYDRMGRVLKTQTDLHANGVVDLQHQFEYDELGRLQRVFAGRGTTSGERSLLADYTYDDGTGQLLRTRYYASPTGSGSGGSGTGCGVMAVDSIFLQRDVQGRLTQFMSVLAEERLFYDGNNPNALSGGAIPAPGPSQVGYHQNWNGNLNGWVVNYKVGAGGLAGSPAAPIVANTVTGFDRRTVYGFKYDGLNRLIQSDASVWENSLAAPSGGPTLPSMDLGTAFGATLTGNRNWYQGDERYSYDKVGNLTGLQRYYYRAPGSPAGGGSGPGGVKGDSWLYEYKPGTNQLSRLRTGIGGPGGGSGVVEASFGYDRNGNLASDSRRGLHSFYYNAHNLPIRFSRGAPPTSGGGAGSPPSSTSVVEYVHGHNGGRTLKRVTETITKGSSVMTETHEVYYLRDAAGTPVAIHDLNTGKWTLELYGSGLVAEAELWESEVPTTLPRVGDSSGVVLGRLDSLKFFNVDHLGNVRVTYIPEIFNDINLGCRVRYHVQSVLDYYPYGKHLRVWFAGEPERWQSTMNERDMESGLDYRGARYYDSEYGRFLGIDPLMGMYPSWSPYGYVWCNPAQVIDPWGLSGEGGGGPWDDYLWVSSGGTGWLYYKGMIALTDGVPNSAVEVVTIEAKVESPFSIVAMATPLLPEGNTLGGFAIRSVTSFNLGVVDAVLNVATPVGLYNMGLHYRHLGAGVMTLQTDALVEFGFTMVGLGASYGAAMGMMNAVAGIPTGDFGGLGTQTAYGLMAVADPAALGMAGEGAAAAELTAAERATLETGATAESSATGALAETAGAEAEAVTETVGATEAEGAGLGAEAQGAGAEGAAETQEVSAQRIHGNSLDSPRPTWGYKLYRNDGTFLKNGITSREVPETRYTREFMSDKYMVKYPFPNRRAAYEWEYQENLTNRGPLNRNMH